MTQVAVAGVVAYVVGGIFPLAQYLLSFFHSVTGIGPSGILRSVGSIDLGMEALVGFTQIIVESVHVGLGQSASLQP